MGNWEELKINDSITIYCHLDAENGTSKGIAIEKDGVEVLEFTNKEAVKIREFLSEYISGS